MKSDAPLARAIVLLAIAGLVAAGWTSGTASVALLGAVSYTVFGSVEFVDWFRSIKRDHKSHQEGQKAYWERQSLVPYQWWSELSKQWEIEQRMMAEKRAPGWRGFAQVLGNWTSSLLVLTGLALFLTKPEGFFLSGVLLWCSPILWYVLAGTCVGEVTGTPMKMGYGGWYVKRSRQELRNEREYRLARRKEAEETAKAEKQFKLDALDENPEIAQQGLAEVTKSYIRSAEHGDQEAQLKLADSYAKGDGASQDLAKALKWYLKSAEQGNAEAQFKVGELYARTQGVPQDFSEAVKWYRKSAEQGHAEAQLNFGVAHVIGKGVPTDLAEAVRWYRKSADQGNPTARYLLAEAFAKGCGGLPADIEEAYRWAQLAACSGDRLAVNLRNRLRKARAAAWINNPQREVLDSIAVRADKQAKAAGL